MNQVNLMLWKKSDLPVLKEQYELLANEMLSVTEREMDLHFITI